MKYFKIVGYIGIIFIYGWLCRVKFALLVFGLFNRVSEREPITDIVIYDYIIPDLITLITSIFLVIFFSVKIFKVIKGEVV